MTNRILTKLQMCLLIGILALSYSYGQNDNDMKKREKEFKNGGKTLKDQGIEDNTIGEALNVLFREYVSRGSCGLIDPERVESDGKKYSYVPDEIANLDSLTGVKKRKVEVINANGTRMFWYVYTAADKDNPNFAPVPTRFLTVFLDPSGAKTKLSASTNFSTWVLTRNCSGYLTTKAEANAKFFTISASAAIDADFRNTASMVLIGGTFVSPIEDRMASGNWQQLLLNLDIWNLYAKDNGLANDAWVMKSFDGILANKETGISRNFKFQGEASGSAPFPIGSIAGSIGTGVMDKSSMDFTQYQLLIASDIQDQQRRNLRFVKLPTAATIAEQFKSTSFKLDSDVTLKKGVNASYNASVAGIPENICRSAWELNETSKTVFESVRVTTALGEQVSDSREKIPLCEFRFTGMPKDSIFAARAPLPEFVGTLKNKNSQLTISGMSLEFDLKQKFKTSTHPVPRYGGPANSSIMFFSEPAGSTFGVSWRDIPIAFTDKQEPVVRAAGTLGSVDSSTITSCGEMPEFQIDGEMAATDDGNYRMVLRSNLRLSSTEYFSDVASDITCGYPATISVQLVAGQSVTRQLTLNLNIPKKKPSPPPTPLPTPIVTPTPTPVLLPSVSSTPRP